MADIRRRAEQSGTVIHAIQFGSGPEPANSFMKEIATSTLSLVVEGIVFQSASEIAHQSRTVVPNCSVGQPSIANPHRTQVHFQTFASHCSTKPTYHANIGTYVLL